MAERRHALKFLISNTQAGTLIGSGGKAIKEFAEVTGARINVSGVSEHYPGSSERVVLISGTFDQVNHAQRLVWEMVDATVDGKKDVSWDPRAASLNSGKSSANVTCKITVPAAAGGLLLGKAGSSIKMISDDSGAAIVMSGKDEALFTHERVLTISGPTSCCVACVEAILRKLDEPEEVIVYQNRGTRYNASPYRYAGGSTSGPRRNGARGDESEMEPPKEGENLNITTTMTIPNEIVGNIFGRKGATMREIISLSGAQISVSNRDEFEEGTTNRIVTITGKLENTQLAQYYISQRLKTPSNPAPKRAGEHN